MTTNKLARIPTDLMKVPQDVFSLPKLSLRPPNVKDTMGITLGSQARSIPGVNVALLMGRRGQGKTAFMTAVLKDRQNKYIRRQWNAHLFANYRVDFFRHAPDGRPIDFYSPKLLEHIADWPEWYHTGITAFDEVHNFATSRRSMSASNLNFSFLLTQIRHRDMECIFTTQFPQVLDYQLLLQVDLFIRVEIVARYPDGFPRALRVSKFDYWGQFTGRDYRKRWPPAPEDVDEEVYYLISRTLKGTYNTREIVTSSYWDPFTRQRVILDEGKKEGGYDDWMLETQSEMLKAQSVNARNPGARYGTIDEMINRLPRGLEFRLDRWLKTARDIEGSWVTMIDLVNLVNDHEDWEAWMEMAPSGHQIPKAFYIGDRK